MKSGTMPSSPFLRCRTAGTCPGSIVPVGQLPPELLRYTLPSRYCDSDKLMNFAWNQFGQITHGLPRVQAICDWVHNNIEYRFGVRAARPFRVGGHRNGATASAAISPMRPSRCAAPSICPPAT